MVQVLFLAQISGIGQDGLEAVRGVEEGRLVHVVPEALNAEVGEDMIPLTEPFPDFRAEKIGKVSLSGPDGRHKGGTVLFFAKAVLLQPFPAGGVLRVDPDACVDDGHQPDAVGFQLVRELFQVREEAFIQGKVCIILHVVDVHADHIQRQAVSAVLAGNLPHVGFVLVAPAALGQAERPFGRDVAAADELTEFFVEGGFVPARQQVKLVIGRFSVECQTVVPGVADVIVHFAREIHKHAEHLGPVAHQQEIVSAVVGELVLSVVGFVGIVCDVMPAPLVDAAGHLTQAVDGSLLGHLILPPGAVRSQARHRPFGNGQRSHDAPGGKRVPECKTLNQQNALLWF